MKYRIIGQKWRGLAVILSPAPSSVGGTNPARLRLSFCTFAAVDVRPADGRRGRREAGKVREMGNGCGFAVCALAVRRRDLRPGLVLARDAGRAELCRCGRTGCGGKRSARDFVRFRERRRSVPGFCAALILSGAVGCRWCFAAGV
jgi:hypothetical protein